MKARLYLLPLQQLAVVFTMEASTLIFSSHNDHDKCWNLRLQEVFDLDSYSESLVIMTLFSILFTYNAPFGTIGNHQRPIHPPHICGF